MAYERLQLYLLEEVTSIENNIINSDRVNDFGLLIKWTGATVNLAELAYGIWLTGKVNNGNANATKSLNI